jgi:hypothetical protein
VGSEFPNSGESVRVEQAPFVIPERFPLSLIGPALGEHDAFRMAEKQLVGREAFSERRSAASINFCGGT